MNDTLRTMNAMGATITTSSDHLDAFICNRIDNTSWNEHRKTNSGPILFASRTFDGFIYASRLFDKCTFEKCTFNKCQFESAYLPGAIFSSCAFNDCSFKNAALAEEKTQFNDCTFNTCRDLIDIFNKLAPSQIRCQNCDLVDVKPPEKKTLNHWKFEDCRINGFTLIECAVTELLFTTTTSSPDNGAIYRFSLAKCAVENLSLYRTEMHSPNFSGSKIAQFDAKICKFHQINLDGSQAETNFIDCDFLNGSASGIDTKLKIFMDKGKIHNVVFNDSSLQDSRLHKCAISSCDFVSCDLSRSAFKSCYISSSNFTVATLHGASIDCERLGTGNDFTNAKTKGFQITRYNLEYLGEKHGNLSNGQKMEMVIIDNVTKLRMSFGGILQLIHMAALSAFIAPYVGYLFQILIYNRYLVTNPSTAPKSDIFRGMWDYIRTAGQLDNETKPFYISIFFIMLLFNILRAILLFQTKKFELEQECIGLPVIISLDWNWESDVGWSRLVYLGFWYHVFKILNVLNMVAVLIHVLYFIFSPVFLPELSGH